MPVTQPPAIRLAGVRKTFGPVVANRDASLEVAAGEIHALVGENGAGKSTLMRVLAGMYGPDAGTVQVAPQGAGALRDVTGWTTAEAIAAGVGMVHQHFMLVPTLTVAENVVLGQELTKGLQLDRARAEAEVRALSQKTGLQVAADRPVSELSVGEAQRVEILKVLYRGARILILDEPTAVLSPPEVRELWTVLRGLAAQGGTVVLITHKLDEVVDISDTITVMRAGTTVERIRTADTTPQAIARAMVGRDVALALDVMGAGDELHAERVERRAASVEGGAVAEAAPARGRDSTLDARRSALEVTGLTVAGARRPNEVDGVSFSVAPGEILGIAGVEGNGQTELLEALAGLARPTAGRIALAGADVTALGVRARADAGLSHIPEDRHRRGLVLDWSIADNLVLGLQHRFSAGARLDGRRIDENARRLVREFDIRPADPSLPARALSGGNQQKIVIAREMTGRDYHVLLAAQPTRGVDVGAIEFIHDQLRRARAAGKAIVLVSADLAEILALADRVAVMYRGRFATVLPRREASAERLGPYMTGAAGAEPAA
ncbi:ABC transporter ATP-binding protein [Roseisolibacter sp. H3M3-2]|uniref:ABC transporter ATP-binding protein n=1 Tax=Roseisolibacter sp. H3M3-2 TaxID=3031323 RepID=UPI0023DC06AC|nr:ABC transporter ATP-binding protein [Roseisolibacter sp. H3M3-2]MDF1502820.1 ABC transporter ATP-binding protein [Roseisolibacter sp. H3M3-2]